MPNNDNLNNAPENDSEAYANLMNTLINEIDRGKQTGLKDKMMANAIKSVGKASIKANTAFNIYNDYFDSDNPNRKDLSMSDVINKVGKSKGGYQKAFKVLVVGVIVVLALFAFIIIVLAKIGMSM